jgi:xylulokinase
VILDEISPELAHLIIVSSGCPPTISIGPKMAWWSKYQQDTTDRATKFVTAAGYVAGRAAGLAGEEAFIDPTYLHFASVTNNADAKWDLNLARTLGIPERLLPRVVAADSQVGRLTQQGAEDFGLKPGVLIAAGCGDTAAAALGAGITGHLQAFDVAGTAAVLGVRLDTFGVDPSGTLLTMHEALGDGFLALAYVGGAGEVVDWIRRILFEDRLHSSDVHADLTAAILGTPPGADGLIVSPHFSGRVCPAAPSMRGTFVGLNPSHGRGHLVRAVLESIAYEYRVYADAVLQMVDGGRDQGLTEVIGMGGGTNLSCWNQIKADVLGVPYRSLLAVDAGTRGSALVAAAALGEELKPVTPNCYGPSSIPNAVPALIYNNRFLEYRAWTARLSSAYAQTKTPNAATAEILTRTNGRNMTNDN